MRLPSEIRGTSIFHNGSIKIEDFIPLGAGIRLLDYLSRHDYVVIENKYGVHRLCRWRIDIPIRSATAQAVNTIQKW